MHSSSVLTNLNIAPGIDYQSILEQMKNSKPHLGGFQNSMGHSSLIVPGPTPKADPSQIFLSPQMKKGGRNVLTQDFDDQSPGDNSRKTRNLFSTLSPAGSMPVQRNNSMCHGSQKPG